MRKRVSHAGLSLAVAVAVLFITLPGGSLASPPEAQESQGLFIPSSESVAQDRGAPPAPALRSRLVEVDLALLEGSSPRRLALNFFDDLVLDAFLEEVIALPDGGQAWQGRIEGESLSQVVLVQRGDLLAGDVFLPGAVYQVRPVGGGQHVVSEIDQSAFPPEMEPVAVPRPTEEEARETVSQAPVDDGSTVDVLVVYTPAARLAAGGTAAMLAEIDLAVADTNASYANSQVSQRLHLVRAVEVSYVESGTMSGNPGDLQYLQRSDDPYLNNVHTLRETYGADAVVLIVHYSPAPYCGVAYQLAAAVEQVFDVYAFAVVELTCATGNLTFGHELGHNMGANHDWYVNSSVDRFTYSHGYFNTDDRWRTMMSYNDVCSVAGVSCTRIPYWSNPNLTYGGRPMGIPAGTSSTCAAGSPAPGCDADNHRTLDDTAVTVANFRASHSGPPAAPSGLVAAAVSATQINLAWTDNSGDELGFKVERSLNPTSGWVEIARLAARETSLANYGLAPGVSYFYRVRAYNLYGDSAYSNVALTHIPLVGPLAVYSRVVDDDNIGGTSGNGNGRIDCGETVAVLAGLRNLGTDAATSVVATLSTPDPHVSIVGNTTSSYGTVPAGGVLNNLDDFNLHVASGLAWGQAATLRLDVSAGNGGPWQSTMRLPIYCGSAPRAIYLPLVLRQPAVAAFDSQFNGSAPGWQPHAGTWWIDNGQWYATDGVASAWSSVSYEADLANLDYEVELSRVGCEDCPHGILVRGSPAPLGSAYRWNSGYGFYVRQDGNYAVFRYDGGVSSVLQNYAPSPAIAQGSGWNLLRVVASGSSLTFYVNGVPVWSGTDGLYPRGRVGLTVYRGAATGYDWLWVNSARLSQPGTSAAAEVSVAQQLLNRTANEEAAGQDDTGGER
ncbi:MAG TPA: M12 family metallo-peptidase [Anaerolineae bacterium]|nr:M12 family metallo-peptidase [Anaerolineae bacterium]